MATPIKIAGISGSLRKDSYNTKLIRAAGEMAPEGVQVQLITLHDIPLFNTDVEAQGWPQPVVKLRAELNDADAVLFATPEYNYSVPGLLKNAIDWLSRPEGSAPVNGKPVAIIGASTSLIGTARAQSHLRQIAFYNAMPLLPSAEFVMGRAADKFDAEGHLTDEKSRDKLASLMTKFANWIRLTKDA
jgi:chromate reductase, NAD(P)H dehydrogenase (quinone)